jgi:serine/threonine protein kinase/tetratricopeptide (TPR) repeat protein
VNGAFGRYRLLEKIGHGGMAEVFKAKSYGVEGFEKVLVIKRIVRELAASQEFVEMFVREAKLSVRLSHANIVQVFDLGIAPGADVGGEKQPDAYYIAMEYVHGCDLATLLARCRKQQIVLPLNMCVFIAAEVAKGLDHAHRRRDEQLRPLGIVHCDVSPQNVLLSFEGEVKVTDFGIAKARDVLEKRSQEDTRARKLQGKFGYMSPEQARGDAVDARSDLFSLGTILYECLAGVNPFHAPTTFETLRRVQAGEYPPVELLRPDTPSDLVAITRHAMAKDPADRFADAGRMYEALLAFLYSHGSRYSAHELSEFLSRFRDAEAGPASSAFTAAPLLDAEGTATGPTERTPVEIPASRSQSASLSRIDTGVRVVAIDRAAEMGERREVTALVVELPRGATTIGDHVAKVVERYGGRIYKRAPEQIAALFGLDDPDGRDTEVATRCALVALRSVEGERRPSAGVHTARVHVSSTGEPTDDERLGTLVATARDLARVREGRIAISSVAMRQVKPLFEFESLSESDHAVPTVSGLLVKDVRGASEAFGRFVGRKDELRKIGEILASATKRVPRAITVRGDHGVGKTRLLVEVERRLRKGGYNVGFHIATCPPRGAELPLSGIVCMLQILCGIAEGDPHDRVVAVQPRLRALGLQEDEVAAVLTVLGANVPRIGGTSKATMRNAFARMVMSLCDDRPHTFAWDAAHALDEESFGILDEVFKRLTSARVVFAFAGRAGFSHPLERVAAHASLDLTDLLPVDVERLVALRLGIDHAPDELVRFVRERAGGHPLFIEEVLRALQDAQAISVAERRIVSMKLVGQELALPKTLRGLVASRVARLVATDRATLQAAAVLGDPVPANVLAQMVGQPIAALEKTIATLKARDLLVHTSATELRFVSPLVPEVIADALTPEAAREMHAAAGNAFEVVLGDRAWEQAARIATHLYEAGDRERAATFFAKSGERRLEGRQLAAAARDYARAITLCDPTRRDPKELEAWLSQLAAAVRLVKAVPEAAEMCERLIARIDVVADEPTRVRAHVSAGHILVAVHLYEAAAQHFAVAETIAAGNDALTKLVLVASAELATGQGEFVRAHALLERLQHIVGGDGDKQEQHKVLLNLSQAQAALGNRAAAVASVERAEQVLPNDATAAYERQKLRALIDYFSRDWRAAAAHSERAVELARATGLSYGVMINLHNLGDTLIRLNDFARAYGALQQSLALCDEFGYERLGSLNRMFLAYLDGVAGRADAEKLLEQGIAYAEASDFVWDAIQGGMMLSALLKRRGDVAGARRGYERTRALAHSSGDRLTVADCDAALAAS